MAVAYSTGWDDGHTAGRRDERLIVEQERRSAVAGAVVRRLADIPPIPEDELRRRREGHQRAVHRIMRGGRP